MRTRSGPSQLYSSPTKAVPADQTLLSPALLEPLTALPVGACEPLSPCCACRGGKSAFAVGRGGIKMPLLATSQCSTCKTCTCYFPVRYLQDLYLSTFLCATYRTSTCHFPVYYFPVHACTLLACGTCTLLDCSTCRTCTLLE